MPDDPKTCKVIRGAKASTSKQALQCFEGVSAESAGAKGLCLHLIEIPPAGRAKPHLHAHHESAVYVVSGNAGMWYGEGLREHVSVSAGDFLYIPEHAAPAVQRERHGAVRRRVCADGSE